MNGKHKIHVLQDVKKTCSEAFELITSEDARKEGFFRNAGLLADKSSTLKAVKKCGEITSEGVCISARGNWISLYNDLFSVEVSINLELETRTWGGCSFPIHIQGLDTQNLQLLKRYSFSLMPGPEGFENQLFGRFSAWEEKPPIPWRTIWYNGERDPFNMGPVTVTDAISQINTQHELPIQRIYQIILRLNPEENYQLGKIALNLIAEFEVMLTSAITHLNRTNNKKR